MADSSSVFVTLGALGGGQPVTTAGVFFNQGTDGPNGQAWWVYDGTNLQGNVPTGKGFAFSVNGSNVATISTAGNLSAPQFLISTNGGFLRAVAPANTLDIIGGPGSAGQDIRFFLSNASTLPMRIGAVHANYTDMDAQVNLSHLAGGSGGIAAGDPASAGRVTIGLGAGTTSSGTNVTASGHDMGMRVGVTVNSTGTVSQPILLGSFNRVYNAPPYIGLTPGNAATAALAVATLPFVQTTTSGWSIIANSTGIPAGVYVWYASGIVQ